MLTESFFVRSVLGAIFLLSVATVRSDCNRAPGAGVKTRPIVEPRPRNLMVALSGTSGKKHAVSWERIYRLGRELDAINTRFEANALRPKPRRASRQSTKRSVAVVDLAFRLRS